MFFEGKEMHNFLKSIAHNRATEMANISSQVKSKLCLFAGLYEQYRQTIKETVERNKRLTHRIMFIYIQLIVNSALLFYLICIRILGIS